MVNVKGTDPMAEERSGDPDTGISYNESSNAIQRLLDKLQKRPKQGGMMNVLGKDESDGLSSKSVASLSSKLDGLIELQHPIPVVKSAWRRWNKVPPGKFMEKTKLVKEHEHLVGVLKSHNPTAINQERIKQAGELKEYKKLSSMLNDLIELQGDPRPRNNLGEFTDQSQGGPNPNSMYKTYTIAPQTPGMSPNKSMISPDTKKLATVALLGGAAGTLGSEAVKGTGYAIKSLAGKLRSKLRK